MRFTELYNYKPIVTNTLVLSIAQGLITVLMVLSNKCPHKTLYQLMLFAIYCSLFNTHLPVRVYYSIAAAFSTSGLTM